MTRLKNLESTMSRCCIFILWILPLSSAQELARAEEAKAAATPGDQTDVPPDSSAGPGVQIVVGFDGSCPHNSAGVRREGPRQFTIYPSWRSSPGIDEEAVGRSTRLGFKVLNAGKTSVPVDLSIDWQYHDAPPKNRPNFSSVEEYMSYRDFVSVRRPSNDKWHTVMVDVDDSVARLRLDTPPGETEVHWHPPYNYTQSEQFVESLRGHPSVQIERIGESPEKRNLWMLRITDRSTQPKKSFLIRSRVHAYESAASYNMEGMVRWLLCGEAYAAQALRRYVFHVIPMANPDGVYNGLGSLTLSWFSVKWKARALELAG